MQFDDAHEALLQTQSCHDFADAGLLGADDIWPAMERFAKNGRRTAIVTLVGVEGGAPRTVGAQLAVAEDGRYHGYLSGGCLEQAVALEAVETMRNGQNQLVRYGRGSKFMDIKLPCGSGMDLFFDCSLGAEDIATARSLQLTRRAFTLESDLTPGANARSRIETLRGTSRAVTGRDENRFSRVYLPAMRLVLFGSGPAASGIAGIARAAGLELAVWSPDDATRADLAVQGIEAQNGSEAVNDLISTIDAQTGVIIAFHEHQLEPDLIARALASDSFYVGALGSKKVHMQRLDMLRTMDVTEEALARIRAPLGLIPGAKSKATLAIGVVADLFAEGKRLDFVP